ncbi:MAG: DNA repair protein RecN, partial [Alphaproteobacteria bacterium]|nr:DNA repair protein RecN [Alphaproteobacteria bacterium]
ATVLHTHRVDAAQKLSYAIAEELPSLKLGEAQFKVDVQRLDINDATEHGLDVIEFLFSANPGMALQPMAKVASGGELSRLMLALKVALSSSLGECRTQTLLFDEIDSGVGGATATAIGSRLKRLSSQQQVIAITHSPQVACFADHHYKVMKSVVGGKTFVGVEKIEGAVRDAELARMLSGEVMTDEALKAAQSLIQQAQTMSQ